MTSHKIRMEPLLRISSAFVIVGLLIEIVSIFWFHPLAFVFFAFFGISLVVIGILVYLASLIFAVSPSTGPSPKN